MSTSGEQAGGEQAFQAAVDAVGVERVAGLDQHVGEDRVLLDALVALDPDGRDRAFRRPDDSGAGGRPERRVGRC